MIANKTLYLTEDREKAVPEGDPKGKFLLVREGMELSDALAEKYGVSGKKAPEPEPPQGGPEPQNREEAMPKRKTRGKSAK